MSSKKMIEPKWFDLSKFIDQIDLDDRVINHLQETNEKFEEYIEVLGECCKYDYYTILYYWLDAARQEHISSGQIEKHKFSFSNEELLNGYLFFDSLNINEKRIKDIHKFVCEHSHTNKNTIPGEFRTTPCWVGKYNAKGEKEIFWCGAAVEDIEKFIKSYIEIYKKNSVKEIYSNPFLKSSLNHLLFVKIHPFSDGNGRVSRIMQNLSFTSHINKIYGTNLKLAPVNISQNIYINQYSYADRINQIVFDPNYDNSEAINRWFDFMLNMYDEQLYFQTNRIPLLETAFDTIQNNPDINDKMAQQIKKSAIKKLF